MGDKIDVDAGKEGANNVEQAPDGVLVSGTNAETS